MLFLTARSAAALRRADALVAMQRPPVNYQDASDGEINVSHTNDRVEAHKRQCSASVACPSETLGSPSETLGVPPARSSCNGTHAASALWRTRVPLTRLAVLPMMNPPVQHCDLLRPSVCVALATCWRSDCLSMKTISSGHCDALDFALAQRTLLDGCT